MVKQVEYIVFELEVTIKALLASQFVNISIFRDIFKGMWTDHNKSAFNSHVKGKKKKLLLFIYFFLQLIEGLKSWESIGDMYILRFLC